MIIDDKIDKGKGEVDLEKDSKRSKRGREEKELIGYEKRKKENIIVIRNVI